MRWRGEGEAKVSRVFRGCREENKDFKSSVLARDTAK